MARRAGDQRASAAIEASSTGTAAKVTGSTGAMSNSRLAIHFDRAAAASEPGEDAEAGHPCALAKHLRENLRGLSAERDAQSDFASALRDQEAGDAVQADGGEQQRGGGERTEQQHLESAGR